MKINAFNLGLPHFGMPSKIRLIVKLILVIMTTCLMQVSASTFGQRITLSAKDASLKALFTEIRAQSGYGFIYTEGLLNSAKPVNVNLNNATIEEALKQILNNQPIEYSIQEKTVILNKKEKSIIERVSDYLGSIVIKGKIVNEKGEPIPGVTVRLKQDKKVVISGSDGRFSIDAKPGDVLVISSIGFITKELTVKNSDNFTTVLEASVSPLDQVQVIGYGADTKRFSVGSVATVTAEQIERQPVTNPLLALQGQAPGLALNATTGVPGSRVQLQIRGQNTIKGEGWLEPYDQPLFIIDGTPFAPQNKNVSQLSNLAMGPSFNGGISQFIGMSPFNGINPADIESISILKDADATSIYGTQGSNGVVIITTKKGKVGKTTFNFTANSSFNTAARKLKLMNTQQYLQLRRDAFAADNVTPSNDPNNYYGYAPDLLIFDQNKYTDWQEVLFGKSSSNMDFHGSLSGGTVNNTFLVSAGYTKSNYNFPGAGYADQRMTLHSALHHNSTDNRLTMDLTMDYSYDQNNSPGGGAGSVLLPPNLPDLLDAQENLVWDYKGVSLSSYQFYAYLKKPVLLQNYNLNNTLRLAYKIFPGLSISVNMGYSRNTSGEHSVSPAAAQNPVYAPTGSAQFTTNNFQSINVEPQIDYTYAWGKGVLTALLGGSYKKNTNNSNSVSGYGYANDNFLGSINGAATMSSYDDGDFYKYSAGFARVKYIYDQKYILSLTGRRDGSSNFGPTHQFGNFGSAGAGWIFSEERGFKKALPFVSYGKLSGSYGTSGSDGISAYMYQPLWQPLGYVPAFQGSRPNIPFNLYNPDYSWALKKSLNVAIDLGFFQDRLLLNATYYRNREGNQLGQYPLADQAGFPSVLENLPSTVQNKGWEFSLNSTNIKTRDFNWTTNFNISFNRNKLLSFPDLESSSYSSEYMIGKPTSIIMGYLFKGLNSTTGLFEYYDKDGNATNSPKYGLASVGGDQVPIADREVKYMGGIGNNFSYKRFNLSIFFQFSSQTAPNYLSTIYGSYQPGMSKTNLPVEALDYWKKPGDQTTLQKLSTSYSTDASTAAGSFSSSTGAYSDDTYLRLKTMALSYSLPDAWLERAHIRDCRLFVNAQNLLTITNYKVGDPEQFGFIGVPLQRTVAFGLNFNL